MIDNKIINEICPQLEKIKTIKKEYNDRHEKYGFKIKGNVIANVIRYYIENLLYEKKLPYLVSLNNSFIDYDPIEWDLIIFKKGRTPRNNIINGENVKVVIEFKTSGTIDTKYKQRTKEEFLQEKFGREFNYVEKLKEKYNHKVFFAYITFSTDLEWFKATKKFFDEKNGKENTAFAFLDDKKLDKKELVRVEECDNFEKFILDLLND